MQILLYMFRASRRKMFFSIVAGLLTGACYTALLGLLNVMLNSERALSRTAVIAFAVLTLLGAGSRLVTELLLGRLSQGGLHELRMKLSAQILQLPLSTLEELGPHRLYAVLVDDIPTVVGFIGGAPLLVTNVALVIGLLVYMGYLSPILLAVVTGFLVVAAASYVIPVTRARKHFKLAREENDHLQRH